MAHARLGPDSDIYLYSQGGSLCCCWCQLGREELLEEADVVAHLEAHVAAGHKVPEGLIDTFHGPGADA